MYVLLLYWNTILVSAPTKNPVYVNLAIIMKKIKLFLNHYVLNSFSLLQVYEAIENRELAEKNFKEALRYDIFCHEAFERLVHHHLLSGVSNSLFTHHFSLRT